MSIFTTKTVEAATRKAKLLGSDVWITKEGNRGEGRLRVRASPHGSIAFFFRYSHDGKQHQLRINEKTLALASDEADRLSLLYRSGIHDLHQHVAMESRAAQARLAAEVAQLDALALEAEAKAQQGTLGDLLTAYADMLKAAGKASAGEVRSQVKKDVETAFPNLWKKPAVDITLDDCVEIIGKLNDEKKPRQADKARSYIKSAYRAAINARGNVKAPKVMRELGITSNPANEINKVKGSSEVSERALSLAEFRAYWKHIQALEEPCRSVAMLHVLTGGQRMQQLARVTLADIDRDAMLMRMSDNKGKREKPRVYWVPLLPAALECIDRITLVGQYVFSCNGGVSPMGVSYISDIATEVCNKMAEAGELQGAPFTGKTVRATVETRLMKKPYRVSSDVLARLLSHGLGGVQARSYMHDPMHEEMLEALGKLWRLLNEEAEPMAEVIQLHG